MSLIGRLFSKEDPEFMLLTPLEKGKLCRCVVLYIFGGCEERSLTRLCKESLDWTGQQVIAFRKNLAFEGRIQKNLKFFLYAYLLRYPTKIIDYLLESEERDFARRILVGQDELSLTIKRRVKTLSKHNPPRNLAEFEVGLTSLVRTLSTYCNKFIWKKHRFIIDSSSTTAQDLVQEVMLYGLYSVYRAYPQIKNFVHMVNIAKQGIHNRGINIIHEAKAQSRTQYLTDENGQNRASTLSINSSTNSSVDLTFATALDYQSNGHFVVCNALMVGRDGTSVEYEPFTDVERRLDLKLSVAEVEKRLHTKLQKKFLHLMMGLYDKEFSKYLQYPNDEWFEQVEPKEYAEKARTYLQVSRPNARKFITHLRKELKDHKH
jgi:hypothetical protein